MGMSFVGRAGEGCQVMTDVLMWDDIGRRRRGSGKISTEVRNGEW